jgi:hypothetical protein
VATEALAAAHEVGYANHRVGVLRSIAEALAKAGMAAEALAAAREIEDANSRAGALRSIAGALAKAGMAAEALVATRDIEYANHRADALRSIAEALTKAGMAPEALAAARDIEYANSRAKALMAVADFWLDQGQDNEVRNLLEEAQGAVSKVFDDNQRSEMMRRLAVILARMHSYRAAREAAEQCSTSEDRLAAYTAILREYHIERDPSLARLFAEEEEDEV